MRWHRGRMSNPERSAMTEKPKSISRYLTFRKFESLLTLRALWLSRLGTFADPMEGMLPNKTRRRIIQRDLDISQNFPPELRSQFETMIDVNVQDGRDMTVCCSWFAGDFESSRMWDEYAPEPDSVLVWSTIERLDRSLLAKQEFTQILEVTDYVDYNTFDIDDLSAAQAHKRSQVKGKDFHHEKEVRLVSMNLVCPGCLNPDGSPPTDLQLNGPGMYDSSRKGIFMLVDLNQLILQMTISPRATDSDFTKINKLREAAGVHAELQKSELK